MEVSTFFSSHYTCTFTNIKMVCSAKFDAVLLMRNAYENNSYV